MNVNSICTLIGLFVSLVFLYSPLSARREEELDEFLKRKRVKKEEAT